MVAVASGISEARVGFGKRCRVRQRLELGEILRIGGRSGRTACLARARAEQQPKKVSGKWCGVGAQTKLLELFERGF